jgi:hypothetical protein
MAKPRPIRKREFLTTLSEPYVQPEKSTPVSSPPIVPSAPISKEIPSNDPPIPSAPIELQPYSNPNETAYINVPLGEPEFNRAEEISLKGDVNTTINIGLEDHDQAILYYLENVIKPTVTQNDKQIKVPVIYGSPELWKSVQADGFYRDKNGKIMVPLIMFKRESFEKNRTMGNKLDGNVVHNVQYFETNYSKRNVYDNFSVLNGQKPQKEYILGIIPDYITLTYKLSIFTDYTTQMNKLIEAIEFASDSYWGDKEKFLFRASITSFPTPVLLENNSDRANKSELTLTLHGYIIPNTINVAQAGPSPKSYNVTKTVFTEIIR